MIAGYCRNCKETLPTWKRVNTLYCSDECRKRFYDINKRKNNQIKAKKTPVGVGGN